MSSLALTLAKLRAEGRLPKSPCAQIDQLKKVEDGAREKRVKVEKSAKKGRAKALSKLTAEVKHKVEVIDETYGKPGKPTKCGVAKKASRKAKVADSPELRRGTKAEQKEHGHGKKDARQIAADHLAEDPHFYDTKPKAAKAKPAKKVAKKATAKKAPKKASKRGASKMSADAKKAKAVAKKEATAAKKKVRDDAAAAKRNAKKQAKAAAHRPQYAGETPRQAEPKAPKKPKAARVPKPKAEKPAKVPKAPKQPRAKKATVRRDLSLPKPREQVFVADSGAANDAVDPNKDALAMKGLQDMVNQLMATHGGEAVESLPAKPRPKAGYVYVWDKGDLFSDSENVLMTDRDFVGARYDGRAFFDDSMFNTWQLKDGRLIAQVELDEPRRSARTRGGGAAR